MKKKWWARVANRDGYGDWIPTGIEDLEEAKFYIKCIRQAGPVKEWLQL